jgi:aldose 1-epimerase
MEFSIMKKYSFVGLFWLSVWIVSLSEASVSRRGFGKTIDGRKVDEFVLRNKKGMEVHLISYGAAIRCIKVPDRNGKMADVALGFDSIKGYESPQNAKFGATCGRYAGMIQGAQFTLAGKKYELEDNCGGNCLHSGSQAFDREVWRARMLPQKNAVCFSLVSPDGDDGFPGTLRLQLTYTLKENNSLWLEYEAETDKKTVLNLLNHVYLNLAGHDQGNIRTQSLQLFADRYVVTKGEKSSGAPTRPVEGTALDFRNPLMFGVAIDQSSKKWGINTVFSLQPTVSIKPRRAIRVEDPQSGRTFECWTTEPDMNLYTANWLKGVQGKGGAVYNQHAAFCPEAIRYAPLPDSPPTRLLPKEKYRQITIYRFGTLAHKK